MKTNLSFEEIKKDLERVYNGLSDPGAVSINELDSSRTVHIAVDMVNGFVKEGALSSEEVLSINEPVAKFAKECKEHGIENLALCDCHPESCTEFLTYPVHCVAGTEESELTDELKGTADFRVFPKLSVNGWLEDDFRSFIIDGGYDTFLITGDCTDMCVIQLALSIKSGLNRINRAGRVIVIKDLVATCSLPTRLPETAELAAFLVMQSNGIEVVDAVT